MASFFTYVNRYPPKKAFKNLIDYAPYLDYDKCDCKPVIFKKESAQPYSTYNARNLRVSRAVNTYQGGRIQFGNTYLPNFNGFRLNYLGRTEGMPGGSGKPIKNKY
jgi:hypothetical protein